jgi:arabinoxylan arabinofuranohydrolase
MKFKLVFVILIFVLQCVKAQNPIVPAGLYIADPSAHVWKDGKIYVYGSRDESPDYYCSWDHYVLSSSDLINWEITKNAFASKGANEQVPYSDDKLYAPDCNYKNGTWYLYYCLASSKNTEGVATSKSPLGPFTNGKVIDTKGINEIDPCVFIDDDGQGYYIWGQFTAKMAKLKPNMTEIDLNTVKDSVITEKEQYFHEGGYMVKRNGIYYFIYAHMGRANRPTCIGYSTSKSPMGPFKYGGVIVDNDHCDPAVWNNHGSIVEMNHQWYVFYHRATHNCVTMRKACIEPIRFNEDGSIPEVEMTTQGAGKPLNALSRIDAERACLLFGNVRIMDFDKDKEDLEGIKDDDKAAYKYIDFGNGVNSFTVNVAPGTRGGKIDLLIDQPWGPSIGSIEIKSNDNGEKWSEVTGKIKGAKGVHALWLRFNVKDNEAFKVDWFVFGNNNRLNLK